MPCLIWLPEQLLKEPDDTPRSAGRLSPHGANSCNREGGRREVSRWIPLLTSIWWAYCEWFLCKACPLSSGHPAVSLSRLVLSCGSRGNVLSGIASSDPCLTPLFITLPFLWRHLPNKASTFYLRLSFSKHRWRSSFCTLSIVFRISKLSIHCWSPLKGFIRNIEV